MSINIAAHKRSPFLSNKRKTWLYGFHLTGRHGTAADTLICITSQSQSTNWRHYTVFSSLIDFSEGCSQLITEDLRKRVVRVIFASACSARLEKKDCELVLQGGNVKEISGHIVLCSRTLVMRLRWCHSSFMHSHRIKLTFPLSGSIAVPHA